MGYYHTYLTHRCNLARARGEAPEGGKGRKVSGPSDARARGEAPAVSDRAARWSGFPTGVFRVLAPAREEATVRPL
jgi:hypothetical protein